MNKDPDQTFIDDWLFNYMGPGLHVWSKAKPNKRIKVNLSGQDEEIPIKDVSDRFLKRALRWIFNRSIDINIPLLKHMTLLLEPTEKSQRLAIQFNHFQNKPSDDNPILEMREKHAGYFSVWNMYMPRLFDQRSYHRQNLEIYPDSTKLHLPFNYSLAAIIDWRPADDMAMHKLTRFVLEKALLKTLSRMDALLSIRDHKLAKRQSNGVYWRSYSPQPPRQPQTPRKLVSLFIMADIFHLNSM